MSCGGSFALPVTFVRIRLTRKFADLLNGVDLRPFSVGQVIDLHDPAARMLVAECWAEEVIPIDAQAVADDSSEGRRSRSRKIREGSAGPQSWTRRSR